MTTTAEGAEAPRASRPRFGGIPTDIDVRALMETFGVPAVGTTMSYERVAEIIHVAPRSGRFKTVTDAWRRRLRDDHNVYTSARDGAFSVRTAPERVDHGAAKARGVVRAAAAAHNEVARTDRSQLTTEQRQQADHVQMVTATVVQSARLQTRRPRPSLPVAVTRN